MKTLIDFLRANGVLEYVGSGVRLALLPDAPGGAPAEEAPVPVAQEVEVRKDGLTPAQQFDLYGREMG